MDELSINISKEDFIEKLRHNDLRVIVKSFSPYEYTLLLERVSERLMEELDNYADEYSDVYIYDIINMRE